MIGWVAVIRATHFQFIDEGVSRMGEQSNRRETLSCRLQITHRARNGLEKWSQDKHAFFAIQDAYTVHIERRPNNQQDNMSFYLFFDQEENHKLAKKLEGRVAVLECIYKNEGFVAIGFQVRGKREPVKTNRRLSVRVRFNLRGNGKALPIDFYTSLRELPIAEERSEYVKKRIASWEGYLRIQEKNADVEDIVTPFTTSYFAQNETKLFIACKALSGKVLQQIEGFSVSFTGVKDEIGQVIKVHKRERLIEIELSRHMLRKRKSHQFDPFDYHEVTFSNFATLSQIRRLRKGFFDLQNGFAANMNLERMLFEERPTVQISKEKRQLDYHNELNEFQKEAVHGAMTAHDLYVIQGPPGTGKTTVISEICHQNVKAGLKTLIASQSNLAVDNALGRLLFDPEIRILRYGRTESIEEEGKRFIEENVAVLWRDETAADVERQIENHEQTVKQQVDQIARLESVLEKAQVEKVRLDKEKENQQKIRASLHTLQVQKEIIEAELEQLTSQLEQYHHEQVEQQEALLQVQSRLQEIGNEQAKLEMTIEEQDEYEQLQHITVKLNEVIMYAQSTELVQTLKLTKKEQEGLLFAQNQSAAQYKAYIPQVNEQKKLQDLQRWLTINQIDLPLPIQLQMNDLSKLITKIQQQSFSNEYLEWCDLAERLDKAIQKVESILHHHQFPMHQIHQKTSENFRTIYDMHEMLDRVARFIIDPTTIKSLAIEQLNPMKQSVLNKLAISLALLYGKQSEVTNKVTKLHHHVLQKSVRAYEKIKNEVSAYLQQHLSEIEEQQIMIQQELIELQEQLSEANQYCEQTELAQLEGYEGYSIEQLQDELYRKQQRVTAYRDRITSGKTLDLHEKHAQDQQEQLVITLTETEKKIVAIEAIIAPKEQESTQYIVQIEEVQETIIENINEQYDKIVQEMKQVEIDIPLARKHLETLKEAKHLQQSWLEMLQNASAYDLDEIRKIYVQNANVIGTTCVASARKEFMEDYPTFDVVIIDEVSKATPPELLLPMLKGKKIILVGDHHQLPPLIGQETLEELVEESHSEQERKELNLLLKESLFERLFNNLPKENKTMLGIQYRMHEKIMKTITPFYEEKNYQLQCGLTESDIVRNHLLETPSFDMTNHLLWFDMPNEKKFFEAQQKGSTSRFNQAELDKIKVLLFEMEEATQQAKQAGKIALNDKKSVGVISFYGEQVKHVDQLIAKEVQPEHLTIRTGSVDKFQGMEMDIIIVSFVRNHDHPNGDIGFAKDYRRLNVALSRARELLIIIGSSKMFTKETKHRQSSSMYKRLLETVKEQNGLREYRGV